MITFACEQCNTAIQVPDEHAGRQGRCPACGTVVTIPMASAARAQPPQPAPPAAQPPMQQAPAQMPPPIPPPAWGPAPLPPGVGEPSKTLAVLALIFGLVAAIPFLGALSGLAALILGGISLAGKKPGKGMAIAGLIAGLVLGTGSTVFAVYKAYQGVRAVQSKAMAASCRANLHSIGAGLAMYSAMNDDRFPDSLQVLVDKDVIGPGGLKCPAAKHHNCGYIYAKPATRRYRSSYDAIVVCDRKDNHDGPRNVLFVDGSVRSIETEAELRGLLSEPQNAEFAKRLREVEGP